MSEVATYNPWIVALIGLLLGVLMGILLTLFFVRRKSGGRTVDQLQHEMDEYKEEVGKHFATTSELFRDMTEKYRDVYNHLASGSQTLCEDSMEHGRLEFTEAKPLDTENHQTATTESDDRLDAQAAADSAEKPGDPPIGV